MLPQSTTLGENNHVRSKQMNGCDKDLDNFMNAKKITYTDRL